MKKIATLCFMVFSFAANAQQSINFREGKFSDVLKMAKAENKPVMYMCYATWCPHCNKMKKEVVTDSVVANFYNKHFVCGWQDMESGEGPAMHKEFNVKSYPTFIYLNPKGQLLYSVSAELTAADFIKEGQNALNEKMQFPFLKAQFEADVTNADNCLTYVAALRKSNLPTEEAAKKYLATQTEPQLIGATNWKIIANGIRDIDSREFQYVLKKQNEFAAVSSPKRVERKILNMVSESLEPYMQASDTVNYFKNRPAAAAIHLFKTDSLIFNYDIKLYENTKNWKAYRTVTAESVAKLAWNNPAQLKEIALVYLNHIPNEKALNDAISWAKRSLELKDSYDGYIIIARLYLFQGDKNSAKDWAEKGKKLAISYKFDTKQADDVLSQIK